MTPDEETHAIESWLVSSEGGYFACRCGAFVDVAGYVNDSTEAALERHIADQNGSKDPTPLAGSET